MRDEDIRLQEVRIRGGKHHADRAVGKFDHGARRIEGKGTKQNANDPPVELVLRFAEDGPDGPVVRVGLLVDSSRSQRVENIGHRGDATEEGDVLSLELRRVARSVPSFVVRSHERENAFVLNAGGSCEPFSVGGMALHDFVFFRIQDAGFVENLSGNDRFSEIVKQAADGQQFHGADVPPEEHGRQKTGQEGDIQGMDVRIFVPCPHPFEGKHHRRSLRYLTRQGRSRLEKKRHVLSGGYSRGDLPVRFPDPPDDEIRQLGIDMRHLNVNVRKRFGEISRGERVALDGNADVLDSELREGIRKIRKYRADCVDGRAAREKKRSLRREDILLHSALCREQIVDGNKRRLHCAVTPFLR